jgi:hypothetical protein
MNNIPEIECQQEKNHFIFWCNHCKDNHFHGAEEGYRVSHCPAYPNGYILKKAVPTFTENNHEQ